MKFSGKIFLDSFKKRVFQDKVDAEQESYNTEKPLKDIEALYMHTAYIDIAKCAESYFKTGKLPLKYNFKWLLQLFSNMLPQV